MNVRRRIRARAQKRERERERERERDGTDKAILNEERFYPFLP